MVTMLASRAMGSEDAYAHINDVIGLKHVRDVQLDFMHRAVIVLAKDLSAPLGAALVGISAHRQSLHYGHMALESILARLLDFPIYVIERLAGNVKRVATMHLLILLRAFN